MFYTNPFSYPLALHKHFVLFYNGLVGDELPKGTDFDAWYLDGWAFYGQDNYFIFKTKNALKAGHFMPSFISSMTAEKGPERNIVYVLRPA